MDGAITYRPLPPISTQRLDRSSDFLREDFGTDLRDAE
jgi:hypothetical protein